MRFTSIFFSVTIITLASVASTASSKNGLIDDHAAQAALIRREDAASGSGQYPQVFAAWLAEKDTNEAGSIHDDAAGASLLRRDISGHSSDKDDAQQQSWDDLRASLKAEIERNVKSADALKENVDELVPCLEGAGYTYSSAKNIMDALVHPGRYSEYPRECWEKPIQELAKHCKDSKDKTKSESKREEKKYQFKTTMAEVEAGYFRQNAYRSHYDAFDHVVFWGVKASYQKKVWAHSVWSAKADGKQDKVKHWSPDLKPVDEIDVVYRKNHGDLPPIIVFEEVKLTWNAACEKLESGTQAKNLIAWKKKDDEHREIVYRIKEGPNELSCLCKDAKKTKDQIKDFLDDGLKIYIGFDPSDGIRTVALKDITFKTRD